MLIRDRLASDGRFLFRWRSYAPLVLLPLFLAALPEEERISQAVGPAVEHIIFFVSVFVGVPRTGHPLGHHRLRSWRHIGAQHAGQRADQLNTSGMYSIVRNPLYIGNFVAILGVLICVKVWWLVAMFALRYWLYIERVIAVEEAFLEQKFGDDYRAWVGADPRVFLPKLCNWIPPTERFSLTVPAAARVQRPAGGRARLFRHRVDPRRVRGARARREWSRRRMPRGWHPVLRRSRCSFSCAS